MTALEPSQQKITQLDPYKVRIDLRKIATRREYKGHHRIDIKQYHIDEGS